MSKYDFSDETHLYYEWVFDTFTDATKLIWELGGWDLQDGKDLDTQWEAIQPILKDAFEKAKKWDQWSMGHYRMTTRERLRELLKIEKKFKKIKKWIRENEDEYLDMQDWDGLKKILGNLEFKENIDS